MRTILNDLEFHKTSMQKTKALKAPKSLTYFSLFVSILNNRFFNLKMFLSQRTVYHSSYTQ